MTTHFTVSRYTSYVHNALIALNKEQNICDDTLPLQFNKHARIKSYFTLAITVISNGQVQSL